MLDVIAIHHEATRLERARWQPLLEAAKDAMYVWAPTELYDRRLRDKLKAAIAEVERT